jgi:hypothetical protein
MARYYREDGFESTASIANVQTSGVIIAAPGVGKSIYLLGASCQLDNRFSETNASGNLIVVCGDGGSADFPGTIKVKENTAVYAIGVTPATLFYYIDDV